MAWRIYYPREWLPVSWLLAGVASLALPLAIAADDAVKGYVEQVKPVLARKCHGCHGSIRQEAGLRLDTVSLMRLGGDSGNVLESDESSQGLLFERVTAHEDAGRMPPEGEPLTEEEIAQLRRWLDSGAPAPRDEMPQIAPEDHWAFQPVRSTLQPPDPPDRSWPGSFHPIDAFVESQLVKSGLSFSPPTDAATLIRRMFLDLHGLPPTWEELEVWSRKLRVPLETAGTFGNGSFPAEEGVLNAPAVQELIDYLLASPRYGERQAQFWLDLVRYADTHGFEVNTPRPHAWPYRDYVIRSMNEDKPYDQFVFEQLAGDTVGEEAATGFLVAAAVLLPGQIGKDDESIRLARQDALDEIIVGTSASFLGLTIGCARCHDHKFDPVSQQEYYEWQAFFAGVEYGDRPLQGPAQKDASSVVEEDGEPQLVYAGVFREPEETYLLSRGNPEQPVARVGPRVPRVLGDLELSQDATESSRRVALARWMTRPDNPLTARVMVNRIWQSHFGAGLVETASDFGLNGSVPTHAELLDWLAAEFVRHDWSIKYIHRLILTSQTYQQSSRVNEEGLRRDASVSLLWCFPSRRLEGEAIRDSLLQVSGRLNLKMGGPGFDFFTSRGGLSGFPPLESFGENELRRMVYAHKVRMETVPLFGAFDCPDAGQATPTRSRSTTPIQALNLFNSPFVNEQAAHFAERIASEVGDDSRCQVQAAFRETLGRLPREFELTRALDVVQQHGLSTLCRVLLNTNEFLFLP
jgi:mono/diheme cytochrome c family protein